MTLREFIEKAIAENGLEESSSSIEQRVTGVARTRQSRGCAVLTDEEVMDIIMDPEMGKEGKKNRLTDPPKEGEKRPSRVVKIDKPKKNENYGTLKYGAGEMESLF